MTILLSSVGGPFSAAHFSGHRFRLVPASGSFAASAFPVPPLHHHWVPSHKAAARFGSRSPRFKQAELGVGSRSRQDHHPDLERWYATRANSHKVEVTDASQAVYVSRPKEVAALIEEAAAH